MSIYRDHAYNDVHTIRKIRDVASPSQEAPSVKASEDDHKHLRKAAPANVVLPSTAKWAAALPSESRPIALLRQYPRIANLIAATWADAKGFETYMRSLVTDQRGNRQGFPGAVLRELGALALQRSHDYIKTPTK